MADNSRKPLDLLLAHELATGATITDAAKRQGCHERTVRRRLEDADFRRMVSEIQLDIVKEASGKLVAAMTQAVETLTSLLGAKAETVRLGACRAILEMGSAMVQGASLAELIAELQAALEEKVKAEK